MCLLCSTLANAQGPILPPAGPMGSIRMQDRKGVYKPPQTLVSGEFYRMGDSLYWHLATGANGVLYPVIPGGGYEAPLTFTTPLSRSVNTISIPAASVSVSGYLTATDWGLFNDAYTRRVTSWTLPLSFSGGTASVVKGAYGLTSISAGYGLTATGDTARSLGVDTLPISTRARVDSLLGIVNGKEPVISAGTSGQYWRGDKSWQTLSTSAVPEGSNLYYTDARARAAISSTMTGLTYTSGSGVFSATSGYAIPTTTSEGQWDDAYTRRVTSWTLPLSFSSGTAAVVKGAYGVTSINAGYGLTGTGDTARTMKVDTLAIGTRARSDSILNVVNGKQAAGNYITALTGDVTASGPGSAAATIGAAKITNTMLAGSIAATKLIGTDITTLGTITTGTWTGSMLGVGYGGTGQTSYTNGQLLIGNTTGNTLTKATLTGTSNQINVTNGSGSITLSTPQNIHTAASPTFAGLTLNDGSGAATISGTAGNLYGDVTITALTDNTYNLGAAGVRYGYVYAMNLIGATLTQAPTVQGGSSSGGNLTLSSTSHATKGKILFGSSGTYDEANARLGIGTTSPETYGALTAYAQRAELVFKQSDATNALARIDLVSSTGSFLGFFETGKGSFRHTFAGSFTPSDNYVALYSGADVPFYFGNNDAVRMMIDAGGGNVSIGSRTTTSQFNVGSSAQYQVNSSGAVVKIGNVATDGGFGTAAIVDTVDQTGLSAAVGSTNFASTSTAGQYIVYWYVSCTTASGTATVTMNISWNDGAAKTKAGTAVTLSSTGNYDSGMILVKNTSGSISFSTTTSGTVGSARYAISLVCQRPG